MNPQSVILLIIIAVLFILALRGTIRNKGCSDGCAGCAYRDSCHKKNKK